MENMSDDHVSVNEGKIASINISSRKGIAKEPIPLVELLKDIGMKGDAHANPEDETRQVSLLAFESIEKQNAKLKDCDGDQIAALKPGAFGENLTTRGIAIVDLKIGDKIIVGANVVLEVSRIGKICHKPCAIYYKTGDCIMPREGIFAKVLSSGQIKVNDRMRVDRIEVIDD